MPVFYVWGPSLCYLTKVCMNKIQSLLWTVSAIAILTTCKVYKNRQTSGLSFNTLLLREQTKAQKIETYVIVGIIIVGIIIVLKIETYIIVVIIIGLKIEFEHWLNHYIEMRMKLLTFLASLYFLVGTISAQNSKCLSLFNAIASKKIYTFVTIVP